MASPGLSGFVQGLANSPLGNLPQLMQAKQRMTLEKEKFDLWKEDRADKAAAEQQRKTALSDAGQIADTQGLAAASDFLIGAGYTDEAASLASINQGRGRLDLARDAQEYTEESGDRQLGLAERQQDYREMSGDRDYGFQERQQDFRELSGERDFGLQERQQDFRELQGDREFGLESRAQDLNEIQGMQEVEAKDVELAQIRDDYKAGKIEEAKAGVGQFYNNWAPEIGSEEYAPFVDGLMRNESELINKELRLGKNRVVIGAEVVTDPSGRQFVAPKILNKKTGTVGPMTENASSDAADNVIKMPVEQFDQMMKGMGAAPVEERDMKWTTVERDGVPMLLDEKSGQMRELTSDPNQRRRLNRLSDVNEQLFKQPTNIFDPNMQESKQRANAIGGVMYSKGFDGDPEAVAPLIANYINDPRIKELMDTGSSEDFDQAAVMVMTWIKGDEKKPQGNVEVSLANSQPRADPRSQMPRREGNGAQSGVPSWKGLPNIFAGDWNF